ncbi:hypothetical protein KW795_01170 [Candidatus Microgenomates bacterium]|nr:hypothetical protein [Candidatus Microgenomates bacterium]
MSEKEPQKERQVIAIYQCVVTNKTFDVTLTPLDDEPAEAIKCKVHNEQHDAQLINIVIRSSAKI